MNREQLTKYLKRVQGKRSIREFARAVGCSTGYLSDISTGKREPGPKVLEALGLQQETVYKKRWR